MNKAWISFYIFFLFLAIQGGGIFFSRLKPAAGNPRGRFPFFYVQDYRIQPPRMYVQGAPVLSDRSRRPFTVRIIGKEGKRTLMPTVPPVVAFVMGRQMAWEQVTVEDLEHIPGISPAMARRLIRIRDIRGITAFKELLEFPHIGHQTVERLRRYCVISHG